MKSMTSNTFVASSGGKRLASLLLALAVLTPSVAFSQAQQPVNLRSTANFAVLAASLISNIPGSAITGNIGLSPATGSNITGFGANEVTGIIYTVDASGPAGSVPAASMLTTAKGDLTLAYNDAAGRTPVPAGAFLNPGSGSGNIGGLTLVPGLYKFTSTVEITGSNLTLAGNSTDVWIFQIASALNVGSGIQVILSGGARASNIFWQVGTSAILGTTSVMKGTIIADQSISMNTGSSLEGRALASIAAVTLASSTVTVPAGVSSLRDGNATPRSSVFENGAGGGLGFTVPTDGFARLTLYTMHGREVAVLYSGRATANVRHVSDVSIRALSRGLYFTKLEHNGSARLEKMILGR